MDASSTLSSFSLSLSFSCPSLSSLPTELPSSPTRPAPSPSSSTPSSHTADGHYETTPPVHSPTTAPPHPFSPAHVEHHTCDSPPSSNFAATCFSSSSCWTQYGSINQVRTATYDFDVDDDDAEFADEHSMMMPSSPSSFSSSAATLAHHHCVHFVFYLLLLVLCTALVFFFIFYPFSNNTNTNYTPSTSISTSSSSSSLSSRVTAEIHSVTSSSASDSHASSSNPLPLRSLSSSLSSSSSSSSPNFVSPLSLSTSLSGEWSPECPSLPPSLTSLTFSLDMWHFWRWSYSAQLFLPSDPLPSSSSSLPSSASSSSSSSVSFVWQHGCPTFTNDVSLYLNSELSGYTDGKLLSLTNDRYILDCIGSPVFLVTTENIWNTFDNMYSRRVWQHADFFLLQIHAKPVPSQQQQQQQHGQANDESNSEQQQIPVYYSSLSGTTYDTSDRNLVAYVMRDTSMTQLTFHLYDAILDAAFSSPSSSSSSSKLTVTQNNNKYNNNNDNANRLIAMLQQKRPYWQWPWENYRTWTAVIVDDEADTINNSNDNKNVENATASSVSLNDHRHPAADLRLLSLMGVHDTFDVLSQRSSSNGHQSNSTDFCNAFASMGIVFGALIAIGVLIACCVCCFCKQ